MKLKVKLQDRESSACNFISWTRLEENLKKSGELSSNESITHLEVTNVGIRYHVTNGSNR